MYDAVVLDAPPTGRIARFLNVTAEVAGLAKVGPIKTQSDGVMAVLRSPQTAVHLVTLLEEMPVQETIDAVAELRAAHLPVGAVIVNMTRPPLLPEPALAAAAAGRVDTAELRRRPGRGRPGRQAGRRRWPRRRPSTPSAGGLEDGNRGTLTELGLPTIELPFLAGAGRPRRPVRAGRAAPAGRGGGVTSAATARPRPCSTSTRSPLDPAHPDRGLLRLRRGRQDHHRRRAGAARRRGAAARSSCSPSTRPAGWPSRWA